MRICKRCGEEKSIEEFHRDRTRNDGRHPWCKLCKNASTKKYYQENNEEILRKNRIYAREHREEAIERKRRWRGENPERYRESNRRYYLENREEILAKGRIYRETNVVKEGERHAKYRRENKEKIKVYNGRYNEEHREERLAYGRVYYQNHKEEALEKWRRRRALKLKAEGTHTYEEFLELVELFNGRCLCCNVQFGDGVVPTEDHIVPLSMGGTNYIENIQPLCGICNCVKATKTIDYREGEIERHSASPT